MGAHRVLLDRPLCQHCNVKPIGRARRLCWGCYDALDVRALYPPIIMGLEYGMFFHDEPAPLLPTSALQGSEEKIRVLCERVELHQGLWHPDDPGARGPRHHFTTLPMRACEMTQLDPLEIAGAHEEAEDLDDVPDIALLEEESPEVRRRALRDHFLEWLLAHGRVLHVERVAEEANHAMQG